MDSLSEAHHDAQRHGEREAGLWSKLSSVVACLLEAVAGPGSISDVLLLFALFASPLEIPRDKKYKTIEAKRAFGNWQSLGHCAKTL